MQVFYHICAIFLKLDTPRRVFQCPPKRAFSFLSPDSIRHNGHRSLFLHKQLHYHFRRIGNRGTRAEDGGDTGFVEEVVVLRGDDTTGSDLVGSGNP